MIRNQECEELKAIKFCELDLQDMIMSHKKNILGYRIGNISFAMSDV